MNLDSNRDTRNLFSDMCAEILLKMCVSFALLTPIIAGVKPPFPPYLRVFEALFHPWIEKNVIISLNLGPLSSESYFFQNV